MDIPFTQFLLPEGRQKPIVIDRPKEISDMAVDVLSTGGRFTAEILVTGLISLAYEKEIDGEIEDVDIDVIPNGPEVPLAVDRLVKRLHAKYCLEISKEENHD